VTRRALEHTRWLLGAVIGAVIAAVIGGLRGAESGVASAGGRLASGVSRTGERLASAARAVAAAPGRFVGRLSRSARSGAAVARLGLAAAAGSVAAAAGSVASAARRAGGHLASAAGAAAHAATRGLRLVLRGAGRALLLVGRLAALAWGRLLRSRLAHWVAALARRALYRPANPRPASFVLLLTLVTVLIVVGLIMVLSASSVEALRLYGSSWALFERQVLWVALGAVALILSARIDFRRWRRLATPLLVVCLVLLLAVLAPHLGVSSGGSSRWLGLGSLRMQPSELAKLGVVIFGADLLTRRADRIGDWKATVRPLLLVVGLACLLVIKQPDMGTALILVSITLGLLFAAGTSIAGIGTLVGLSGAAALVVALAEPYRRARLLSFLNPWAHASGSGYQVVQSLVGLGSGHLLGVGLGASAAKWGFLPNAYTDFIFSVLGEELGLVGSLLVVGLFVALAVVGIRIAVRSADRFGALLAAGVTTWIVVQAVINIGGVSGMLPVTGVPLPFISFGGSSLVIMMAAVGMVLNVASQEQARPRPAIDPSPIEVVPTGVTPLWRPETAWSRAGGGGRRPVASERGQRPAARRRATVGQATGRGAAKTARPSAPVQKLPGRRAAQRASRRPAAVMTGAPRASGSAAGWRRSPRPARAGP
jgi:cell division protein FtsW